MSKILNKKISTLLVFTVIFLFNVAPTFAGTNTTGVSSLASYPDNYNLTDNATCSQYASPNDPAVFYLTAPDPNQRTIEIFSTAKTRMVIHPIGFGEGQIAYDSGDYRQINMVAWSFIPNVKYVVEVYPESVSSLKVDASLYTAGNFSYVTVGPYSVQEKNVLYGSKSEYYGLAFKHGGKYEISVTAGDKVAVIYTDSNNSSKQQYDNLTDTHRSCKFTIDVAATGTYQNNYVLTLWNMDAPNLGVSYTVTIRRIG